VTVTTGAVTVPPIVLKPDTGASGNWWWIIIIILIVCILVGLIGYGMSRREKAQMAKQEEAKEAEEDALEDDMTEAGTDMGASYPPPPPPE